MKTALSVPNELFHISGRYAEKLGLSRSELYVVAISEFIERNKKKQIKSITQKINEICDKIDMSSNPQITAASRRILLESEW